MTEKFWIVWTPYTGQSRVKHSSYQLARNEAERLAGKQPDVSFFVLEALSESKKVNVITTMLEEELPF